MNILDVLQSAFASPAAAGPAMAPRRQDPAAPVMPQMQQAPQQVPIPAMRPDPSKVSVAPAAAPQKDGTDRSFTARMGEIFGNDGQFSIRDILEDTAAGLASPNRGNDGWSGFGAGAYGALSNSRGREDRSKKLKIAEEDRKMKLEDRELDRSLKKSGEERAQRKEKRDEKASELREFKTVFEIMEKNHPKAKASEKIAINRETRNYMKDLRESSPEMSEADILAAGAKYKRDLEREVFGGGESTTKTEEGAKESRKQESPEMQGSGTQEDPHVLPQAGAREAFEQLPSGAFFVNPRDGKVLQKK